MKNIFRRKFSKRPLQRFVFMLVAAVFTLTLVPATVMAAPEPPSTEEDLKSFVGNTAWYDPTAGICAAEGASPVESSKTQDDNAKIVIGIAKTLNLGQKGALIGLMTAITESGLKNYANSGIPVSMQNPAWLALAEPRPLGNDHDSVGIMQQRVSTGWSTEGNGPTQDVTWQLMNPAYAAQAFFGTPEGAKLPDGLAQPSALKKGLQNLGNWQSMDPGAAAQAVQISAYPGRYNDNKPRAQAILDRLWESSPPITLPIPLTGGAVAPDSVENQCIGAGGHEAILQKIKEYAWADYRSAGTERALAKKGDQPGTDKDTAYAAAVNRSKYKGDGCHGGGVDCGAFVTIVMRESGADPSYNEDNCNTTCQLAYLRKNSGAGGKYSKVATKDALQPGDIAIRADGDPFAGRGGHTFFFVGTAITEDSEGNPWTGGQSASASQCERAPMASGTDDFDAYEWYHLN